MTGVSTSRSARCRRSRSRSVNPVGQDLRCGRAAARPGRRLRRPRRRPAVGSTRGRGLLPRAASPDRPRPPRTLGSPRCRRTTPSTGACRPGGARLDLDLVLDIVRALGGGPAAVTAWRAAWAAVGLRRLDPVTGDAAPLRDIRTADAVDLVGRAASDPAGAPPGDPGAHPGSRRSLRSGTGAVRSRRHPPRPRRSRRDPPVADGVPGGAGAGSVLRPGHRRLAEQPRHLRTPRRPTRRRSPATRRRWPSPNGADWAPTSSPSAWLPVVTGHGRPARRLVTVSESDGSAVRSPTPGRRSPPRPPTCSAPAPQPVAQRQVRILRPRVRTRSPSIISTGATARS